MVIFEYRTNNYFNAKDTYLVKTNLNKVLLTKLHFENGSWFTNEGMQYKATSVKMIKIESLLNYK